MKKIKIGLGITVLAFVIALNVKTFSITSNNSTIDLSNLLSIAMASSESGGGGIATGCLELGNNFPTKKATTHESYCSKSKKNETYQTCDQNGSGCTEIKWK